MAIFLRFFFYKKNTILLFFVGEFGNCFGVNGGVNDLQVSEITDGVYGKWKQKGFSVSLRLFCLER